jgi:hypothetical protein
MVLLLATRLSATAEHTAGHTVTETPQPLVIKNFLKCESRILTAGLNA